MMKTLDHLDGYLSDIRGSNKNPATKKQKDIIKDITNTLGVRPKGRLTSKAAWNFIEQYYEECQQIKDLEREDRKSDKTDLYNRG